jgi:hypothetical protein
MALQESSRTATSRISPKQNCLKVEAYMLNVRSSRGEFNSEYKDAEGWRAAGETVLRLTASPSRAG